MATERHACRCAAAKKNDTSAETYGEPQTPAEPSKSITGANAAARTEGRVKDHSGGLTMRPHNPQNLLRAICLAERLLIKNYFRSYLTTKFRYGKRMLGHRLRGQPRVCPYCGPGSPISRLRRKKLIVDILQCDNCRLIFRWPADTLEELDRHYDSQYAEEAPPGPSAGAQRLTGASRSRFCAALRRPATQDRCASRNQAQRPRAGLWLLLGICHQPTAQEWL